ncbi:tetratricopeptide repeat protein [Synechococcus sp. Cruz-7E5]|uniref:tetratricopeptide repeat protein n=1 Tax=unclassified Synechococcus TaxID=2626047 RepID=UPI0037DA19A2
MRAVRRWVGAIAWFERALAADPADPRPLLAIGQIHRQMGDPEAARACFEQVVWQSGLHVDAGTSEPQLWAHLAIAYAELKAPEQAI